MSIDKRHILMCKKSDEIQKNWKLQVGDWIVTKGGAHNIFVISSKYDYHESIGGTHWYFGGGQCVRGEGNLANETYCHTITMDGKNYTKDLEHYGKPMDDLYYSKPDSFWFIPRQDQLQKIANYEDKTCYPVSRLLMDLEEFYTSEHVNWLGKDYDHGSITWEQLWLDFVMKKKYNKEWICNEWVLIR